MQKELTFQDICQNQDIFDDDDEDDIDWEPVPLEEVVEVTKWVCKNCTGISLSHYDCCMVCL